MGDTSASDPNASGSAMASAVAPPLPPTLAELFERDEVATAMRSLRAMDPGQARAEIPQAFATVPSAPSCFLRCVHLWMQQNGSDTAVNKMLGPIETAVLCVRSMHPPPSISESDAQLAGTLLHALRECRTSLVAGFAIAFCVPEPVIADVCMAALRKRALVGVQLLDALRMRHLVPAEKVLLAAIDQDDMRAGDVFVKRDRELQVLFVNLLVTLNASDKVVKKRISEFKLDPNAFPQYAHRRKLAALRYLVYSEQFVELETFVSDSRELQEYACRILIQKRGAADAVTQYFVHATGCAQAFPHVDASSASTFVLPPQDEYEPLPSCLALADTGASVTFVDTVADLERCVAHLTTEPVVGFDCEWKATRVAPSGADSSTSSESLIPCATLQLAGATRAFVIDIIALGDIGAWLAPLFLSDAVLKLGFATRDDLKLLRAILGKPHGGHDAVVSNLLDLQMVARKIHLQGVADAEAAAAAEAAVTDTTESQAQDAAAAKDRDETVPVPKSKRRGAENKKQSDSGDTTAARDNSVPKLSLTGLAELYLGKPLDKRVRLSDWERRPLTRAQLEYAALDAFVLVHILAKMQQQHTTEFLTPIVRRCTQKNVR